MRRRLRCFHERQDTPPPRVRPANRGAGLGSAPPCRRLHRCRDAHTRSRRNDMRREGWRGALGPPNARQAHERRPWFIRTVPRRRRRAARRKGTPATAPLRSWDRLVLQQRCKPRLIRLPRVCHDLSPRARSASGPLARSLPSALPSTLDTCARRGWRHTKSSRRRNGSARGTARTPLVLFTGCPRGRKSACFQALPRSIRALPVQADGATRRGARQISRADRRPRDRLDAVETMVCSRQTRARGHPSRKVARDSRSSSLYRR